MTRDDRIILSKMNKKRAWRAMSSVTLLLFATSFLSYAMSYGASLLLAVYGEDMQRSIVSVLTALGVNKMDAFSAVRQLFASGVAVDFFNIVITVFAMVLPTALYSKMVGQTTKESFCINGKIIKHFVPMFCLCQLITTTASTFAESVFDFIAPVADGYSSGMVVADEGIFALVMSVLCTSVLVPVAEEFMFRGVIFSHLKRHGLYFAIVASATLFGVAHSEPVQSIYAFAFGIVSATLVAVSGNIKTSIIFHALNNLVTVLIEYLMKNLSETTMTLIYCLYYIAVLFFAFVGIYHLAKKNGFIERLSQEKEINDGALVEYVGMKEIMCFPFVIYILMYGAEFVLGVFA